MLGLSTTKQIHANYINALAVSVLRLFEPAGSNTLGAFFPTLGDLFSRLIFLFFM
jgi:hypothetical protein